MFSADSDRVMDGLPHGLTDKSNDVWVERNFPGKWSCRKFHTVILMGIFTMNLADGWTDGTNRNLSKVRFLGLVVAMSATKCD